MQIIDGLKGLIQVLNSVRGRLGQETKEQCIASRAQAAAALAGGLDGLANVLASQLEMIVRDERRCSAGQLVGHASQGIEVRPGAEGTVLTEHLRRRIPVIVREAVELDAEPAQRQREVPQNDPILTAEEDVGGLDRPVHDSVRVQRRQRPEELAEDLHDLIRGEDAARLQQLLECDSIHIVPHHKVDVPVGEARTSRVRTRL